MHFILSIISLLMYANEALSFKKLHILISLKIIFSKCLSKLLGKLLGNRYKMFRKFSMQLKCLYLNIPKQIIDFKS